MQEALENRKRVEFRFWNLIICVTIWHHFFLRIPIPERIVSFMLLDLLCYHSYWNTLIIMKSHPQLSNVWFYYTVVCRACKEVCTSQSEFTEATLNHFICCFENGLSATVFPLILSAHHTEIVTLLIRQSKFAKFNVLGIESLRAEWPVTTWVLVLL